MVFKKKDSLCIFIPVSNPICPVRYSFKPPCAEKSKNKNRPYRLTRDKVQPVCSIKYEPKPPCPKMKSECVKPMPPKKCCKPMPPKRCRLKCECDCDYDDCTDDIDCNCEYDCDWDDTCIDDYECDCDTKCDNVFQKCFPVAESSRDINIGDLITVGKGDDGATAHRLLCDQWEWAAAVDSIDFDIESKIAVDNCGNTYVVGRNVLFNREVQHFYNGTTDGTKVSNVTGRPDVQHIFVGKIDTAGVWQWAAAIDGMVADFFPNIVVDKCGDVYVSAFSVFGEAVPLFYNSDGAGGVDLEPSLRGKETALGNNQWAVAKINSSGKWQWVVGMDSEYEFPSEPGDEITSLAASSCGSVYVSGYSSKRPNFYNTDASGNTLADPAISGIERGDDKSTVFVAKLKPTGIWEWVAGVDGKNITSGFPLSSDVSADSCGNVYVASVFIAETGAPNYYNALQSGNTNDTLTFSASKAVEGQTDVYIGKIDCNGVWEWSAVAGGLNQQFDQAISTDNCGNIYVTSKSNPRPLLYNEGSTTVSVEGISFLGLQTFVAKLKCNGKWEWVATVSSEDTAIVAEPDIATDSCGNIYVATRFDTRVLPRFYSAGVTGKTLSTPAITGRLGEGSQLLLGKLSPSGEWSWAVAVDAAGDDSTPSIGVDNCGNVYLAGVADGQPQLYDSAVNGNTLTTSSVTGIEGVQLSIVIAKLANEARSAPLIGVVQGFEDDNVCINLSGIVEYQPGCTGPEELEPGCSYYVNCSRDPEGPTDEEFCPSLTTDSCTDCCCPNRCVGVACDVDSLIWNLEQPLCHKKKDCCCCSKKIYCYRPPEANNDVFTSIPEETGPEDLFNNDTGDDIEIIKVDGLTTNVDTEIEIKSNESNRKAKVTVKSNGTYTFDLSEFNDLGMGEENNFQFSYTIGNRCGESTANVLHTVVGIEET